MKFLGVLFVEALLEQYFPRPHHLMNSVRKHSEKLFTFLSPRVQVTFNEFMTDRSTKNEAYTAIETYLRSSSSAQARRLKGEIMKNSRTSLFFSMDDNQKVGDEFEGVQVWWSSGRNTSKNQQVNEARFYKLIFHQNHRNLIMETYLNHVLTEGKEMVSKTRKTRRFFINSGSSWSQALLEHPSTFQTLAMEPEKKRDIVNDLLAFSKNEDFYTKIGRVWRRVYFLYGPPGTGKSTMIAAMANLLGYDVYDLELAVVKSDPELKELLMGTSRKAIIVIKDIDLKDQEQNDHSVVLDDCGGERIVVFVTNYAGKLNHDWIGRCRVDKHIEMSYCGFEGFKVLAKNYLDLEWHPLFPRVGDLMRGVKVTPADVAEVLMPKCEPGDAEFCLKNLISTLERAEEEEAMENVAEAGRR